MTRFGMKLKEPEPSVHVHAYYRCPEASILSAILYAIYDNQK